MSHPVDSYHSEDHASGGHAELAGHHPGHTHPQNHEITIQIDRTSYREAARELNGEGIRRIPTPPIPADRDLFEVVPGAPDLKILGNTVVRLRDGQRFFTAPGQINPGSGL